jgi:tetratricopeptide (TPR) repeat protein
MAALLGASLVPYGRAGAQRPRNEAAAAFDAGRRAFEAGDYREALTQFERARAEGLRGPALAYDIGVSAYKLGDYARAETVFRDIAARYPRMRSLARYNLGLALLKQGRDEAAATAFDLARAGNDPRVAALADAALRRLGRRPTVSPPREWVKLVDFDAGQDDNVVLRDEASLPPSESTGSAFADLFAFLGGPLGAAGRFRVDASGYFVRYSSAAEFNQSAVRIVAAYRWHRAEWRALVGPSYGYSTLGGKAFEQSLGASLDLRRRLGGPYTLAIELRHDRIDAPSSSFDFVAGTRERIQLSIERLGAGGRLAASYGIETNDRADAGVSPDRGKLRVEYRYRPRSAWSLGIALAYRDSRYPTGTTEALLEASMDASRDFAAGWRLKAQYLRGNNDSNVAALVYRRNRISIGASKLF